MKSKICYVTYGFLLILSLAYVFRYSDTYETMEFTYEEETKKNNNVIHSTGEKENSTKPSTENSTTKTPDEGNGTIGGENVSGNDEVTTEEPTTEEPTTEEPTTSEADNYDYYYNDGDVRIAINAVTDKENKQKYYVADVQLSSIKYFTSMFAYGKYSTKLRQGVTEMAEMTGAIFAVSGDYYSQRSNGCVIRNGVLYKNTKTSRDLLVMYENGDLDIIPYGEYPDGEELIEQGVIQAYIFGPAIVEDGKAVDEVRKTSDYIEESHPRMIIGQIDTLHYLFVAVDGRRDDAVGMDIYECGELMESLGCRVAYNLDGGGTTTMVFQGEIINVPSQGSERAISDGIGILGGGN